MRYMVFCLSTAVTSALAYDEKRQIQPEVLIKGCLEFAGWYFTQNSQKYTSDSSDLQNSADCAASYFKEFAKYWSVWPELEKAGENSKIIDLISSIVHIAESSEPITESDKKRLGPLALEIDCRLPAMRRAFVELAS